MPISWEDLCDPDSLAVDRRLAGESLWVPSWIGVDGPLLLWAHRGKDGRVGDFKPLGGGLLDGFIRLADATGFEEVVAYARRWGVLGLCDDHHLPYSHNPVQYPFPFVVRDRETGRFCLGGEESHFGDGIGHWGRLVATAEAMSHWEGNRGCYPTEVEGGLYCERMDLWVVRAKWMKALATIVARLREGLRGEEAEWTELAVLEPFTIADRCWDRGLEFQWDVVASILNSWFREGGVGLRVRWDSGSLVPTLSSRNVIAGRLWGTLVTQLSLAVGGSPGLALCSGCTDLYYPTRRPNPNRARYCQRCQEDGTRDRDRKARERARKRGSSAC